MLDVLYLTHNRREFTELTFELLVQNTNWDLVDNLIVYDDSSTDGAREAVANRIGRVPVPAEIRDHDWGSPVAVMNDYVSRTDSKLFAKIDNDLALPPAWLDAFLSVMEENPNAHAAREREPLHGAAAGGLGRQVHGHGVEAHRRQRPDADGLLPCDGADGCRRLPRLHGAPVDVQPLARMDHPRHPSLPARPLPRRTLDLALEGVRRSGLAAQVGRRWPPHWNIYWDWFMKEEIAA